MKSFDTPETNQPTNQPSKHRRYVKFTMMSKYTYKFKPREEKIVTFFKYRRAITFQIPENSVEMKN